MASHPVTLAASNNEFCSVANPPSEHTTNEKSILLLVITNKENWLVVSTYLKNISQNGHLPQVGVKIKNMWKHLPEKHVDVPFPSLSSGGYHPSWECHRLCVVEPLFFLVKFIETTLPKSPSFHHMIVNTMIMIIYHHTSTFKGVSIRPSPFSKQFGTPLKVLVYHHISTKINAFKEHVWTWLIISDNTTTHR